MQKVKKQKFTSLFIGILSASFLLAQTASAATPAISNVTGTVANGQTLTISGENMVDESTTDWRGFFAGSHYPNAGSFEGADFNSDGWTEAGSFPKTYDTDVKLIGSKSARFDTSGACSSVENNRASYVWMSPGGADEYYFRGYTRVNLNHWPTMQWKWFMGFPQTGNEMIIGGDNGSLPGALNFTHDGVNSGVYFDASHAAMEQNRWYCVEGYFKGTINPHGAIWIDGQQRYDGNLSGTAVMSYAFSLGTPNVCGTPTDFSMSQWVDGVAVSSSRVYPASKIEISGDDGVNWIYQPPIFLSNTSSNITANLPTLAAVNYLLRVTNNLQETSTTYNLSGANDTTPPASPSGLSVS